MTLLSMVWLQALLLGLGLQHKIVEDLEKELDLPATQLLGLFNKVARKLYKVCWILKQMISSFCCTFNMFSKSSWVPVHICVWDGNHTLAKPSHIRELSPH